MDKEKAMTLMAESHRETVEELEDHLRIANQYVKKEREINLKLRKQSERYREALIKVKLGSESDVIHYSTRLKSINKIAVEALEGES